MFSIELGNEQYNEQFVEQVAAMEARAKKIGVGGKLKYIFPSNGGLNPADTIKAKALGIDAQMAADIHVGGGGGVEVAIADFKAEGDFKISAINQETNAGTHNQARAMSEAADLNDFFNAPAELQSRILGRTASFCTERSGHFDAFDQGISFFLPNASWLQPPGHVHAMIHSSWQPSALNVTVKTDGPPPTWTEVKGKSLTCSGSEYRGTGADANHTAEGCLAAAQKAGQGVDYAVYPGNNGCFLCSIAGDIEAKLIAKPGAVSFVGKDVIAPMSVSAQQSADGAVVVVRIVHTAGTPGPVELTIVGEEGADAAMYASATATQLQSDNLTDANPSWDVDKVSPKQIEVTISAGKASMTLPAYSYTVLTVTK